MDHMQHKPLSPEELTESVLIDAPIYGADEETVGTISHVHGNGAIREVVIDVGGFLNLISKPVLVSIDEINLMRDENGDVHGTTEWTKQQLQDLPEHRH